jgi:hypothetical protein
MSRLLSRQAFGVVLVALLVVTAGCSGLGGTNQADSGDDSDEEEAEQADEEDDSSDESADDGGDAGGDETTTASDGGMTVTSPDTGMETPGMGEFGNYEFSEGESYTYATSGGSFDAEYTWEVTDVSGEQVTVEVTASQSGQTSTTTLEGTQDTIIRQAGNDMAAVFFLSLRAGNLVAEDRSLTVGNSWTVSVDEVPTTNAQWETSTVEVTGTDSYNGIQCSVVEITPDTGTPATFCINGNYPFALSFSSEGGDDGMSITLELTDASR